MNQGETAEKFYIIVNGRVEVVTDQEDGSERFVANLESGDYFGEIGLLIGGIRVATVRALSDVQTVSFDREAFIKWLSKSPESKSEVVSTAHERLSDIVKKRNQ